jgi:hypothetical protein
MKIGGMYQMLTSYYDLDVWENTDSRSIRIASKLVQGDFLSLLLLLTTSTRKF